MSHYRSNRNDAKKKSDILVIRMLNYQYNRSWFSNIHWPHGRLILSSIQDRVSTCDLISLAPHNGFVVFRMRNIVNKTGFSKES